MRGHDHSANETLTISDLELQAELDSLRSLRRRSLSRPSDALDPDLPSVVRSVSLPPSPPLVSPPASPLEASDLPFTARYVTPQLSIPPLPDGSKYRSPTDADTPMAPLNDLMWLPAHLHPDIAPQEFRAFLAEQTKPDALMRRSGSLNRRSSMLSRQYTPSAQDNVGSTTDEVASTLSDTNMRKRDPLENLTISDLQRLEQLAVQASQEGDAGDEGKQHFQNLLRRSMSTGPVIELDTDSQPLIQAPGGLIRRTARTKIRKPSLAGDGGGHRFGLARRKRIDGKTDDEPNEAYLDHSDTAASSEMQGQPAAVPPKAMKSSEESSASLPGSSSASVVSPLAAPLPVLHRHLPSQSLTGSVPSPRVSGPGADDVEPVRAAEPIPLTQPRPQIPNRHEIPPPSPPPAVAPAVSDALLSDSQPSPSSSKKSGWSRLVSRASSAKTDDFDDVLSDTSSDIPDSSTGTKKQKRGIEGVFGGLFRSAKAREEPRDQSDLLASSVSPTASGMLNKNGQYTNFYRLPIHVERAVYRLSHIKLANPRRPLYEQVLISNLMFWYLGVINRPVLSAEEADNAQEGTDSRSPTPRHLEAPPLAKRPASEATNSTSVSALPNMTKRRNEEADWVSTWPRDTPHEEFAK